VSTNADPNYRYPFSPYPDGWYCLAFSDQLVPGQIRAETFMGEEVVLFRTQSGEVAVTDAYCPHMGSHLAHGGDIQGETIRCPFHSFCFDTQGNCTKTGYDTKPPPKAKLKTWPSREQDGVILVYYDAKGRDPNWEVPRLEQEGWTPILHEQFQVRSHPQETSENSVDFGHFSIVHGYTDPEVAGDLKIDGPHLHGRYTIQRKADVFLQNNRLIKSTFDVHVWGLGYSLVEVQVPEMNLNARVYVFAVPVDGKFIHIRSGSSIRTDVKPSQIHWGLSLMPKRWAHKLVTKMTLKGYTDDLKQDFDIWTNKIYVDPPVLAKGDGPIPAYRKYCRQFYPDMRAEDAAKSMQSGQSGVQAAAEEP